MNEEVISAFQNSTTEVFKTMLGLEITGLPVHPCDHMFVRHEVSGIIGLSGGMAGDVIVSFDKQVALLATGALLGTKPTELDNDVVDAVGELTNMIAGSAKGTLEKFNMQLALPTVILGKGHRIGFKSGVDPISMPYESEWGQFNIEVGLMTADVGALVG
ncbi:MAG: chemotaxis protein CheX [Pirellulales bacterium]|nr:chemotaxis protein CheX [Pirellulales bacterium]